MAGTPAGGALRVGFDLRGKLEPGQILVRLRPIPLEGIPSRVWPPSTPILHASDLDTQ